MPVALMEPEAFPRSAGRAVGVATRWLGKDTKAVPATTAAAAAVFDI